MKLSHVAIAISAAFNVALVGAFALRPTATAAYFRAVLSPSIPMGRTTPAPASSATTATGNTDVAVAWSALNAGDLADVTARLRAAGFPPRVLRAIVTSLVNEQFGARRRDLLRDRVGAEYWKNGRSEFGGNLQLEAAMRNLNREQEKTLRDLLGEDYNRRGDDDDWRELGQRRQFGDIPKAKIDQFYKIQQDYNELIQKVHEDGLGIVLPEDRAQLAMLEKEKRADIERLFAPDELLEYDLRNSTTANFVRNRAGRFDLTEAEFRALYAAQKSFDDEHPSGGRMTSELNQARQAELDAAMRSVLGEQRYAEFKQRNDSSIDVGQQEIVTRLVTRLGLPVATVPAVIAVQQDVMQRAGAIRGNSSLNLPQRTEQLVNLADEAVAKLKPVLGDRGLEAYKLNGGQWLNGLTATAPGRGGSR